MATVQKILSQMKASPKNVAFNDLVKVCDVYFERKPSSCTSHVVYKTPWQGDPRVNIQNANGKAKPYQVRQVLDAIEKVKKVQK